MVLIYGSGGFETYLRALEKEGLQGEVSLERERGYGALLLPGGGDIPNVLDRREREMIECFLKEGRPILGICRGMQALNVYFGGTLHPRIRGHQAPGGDLWHPVEVLPPLCERMAPCPRVNSNHHQAVKALGFSLRVAARAADGTVEALCHTALPVVGVQWHPERMGEAGRGIFRWLKEAMAYEGCS